MPRRSRVSPTCILLAAALPGCSGEPSEGLAPARATGGPRVVFDLEHKPLPEVPLPNDYATRLDPTSPTGRRVNVSLRAVTRFEQYLRAKFGELDGFGVFSPISVRFDAPLDVQALATAFANDDFRDDPVYLLNVDGRCGRFGEEIALDVGRGRFPILLAEHGRREFDKSLPHRDGNRLFEHDPAALYNQLLFEERNEDVDADGVLDPGEDTDDDGVLDVANLDDPHACDGLTPDTLEHDRCIADHLLTFYERETNTLLLRPVWPLEQRCQHAVVLTNRLRGADGRAIESPFPAVNARDQTEALRPLANLLPRYGLGVGDVSFAWTFTTGSMTHVLEGVRRGLYGHGPLARLGREYPVESALELVPPSPGAGPLWPDGCAGQVVNLYWQRGISEYGPNMCAFQSDNSTVGAGIWGTFRAPYFMVDKTGWGNDVYPNDANETFDLDPVTGRATYGDAQVTFACTLPKKAEGCTPGNPEGRAFCPPYPVAVYSHGYGSTRAEFTSYLGRAAALGMASCTLDAPGHGGQGYIDFIENDISAGILRGLLGEYGSQGWVQFLFQGRDRDLNNDPVREGGGDIYQANLFHTRDMLNQAAIEYMQFVRVLRSMDGRLGPDGSVFGDWDGDGTPELGGPSAPIGLWGISMGGLITQILGGAEPAADATVPISGGAGLTDASLRSTVGGLPTAVFLPVIGPFVAGWRYQEDGTPYPDGETMLGFIAGDIQERRRVEIGRVSGLMPGDTVELVNLEKGESARVHVNADGVFRVSVAADALDPLERRPELFARRLGRPARQGDAELRAALREPILEPIRVEDPEAFGDRLAIRFYDGSGAPKPVTEVAGGGQLTEVRTFLAEASFQGTLYPAGRPLVAIQKGLGYQRNTPQFRRFLGISQNIMDPVDAAVWSTYYFEDQLDTSYDPNAYPGRNHVFVMPTAGDMVVPVNTAIATARTAGILGSWRRNPALPAEQGWRELFVPDARFGESLDRRLVSTYVVENLWRLHRHDGPGTRGSGWFFDIDDLSDQRAEFPCSGTDLVSDELSCVDGDQGTSPPPRPSPGQGMRATRVRADGSADILRIPYLYPHGQHGMWNAQHDRVWDADAWITNLALAYMRTGGKVYEVPADCDCSASTIPSFVHAGQAVTYSDVDCTDVASDPRVVRVCSAACATALGMQTAPQGVCQ